MLAFLEAEIAAIQGQIYEHIDSHPDLKGKRDLLTSIPGIAHTSAAAFWPNSVMLRSSPRPGKSLPSPGSQDHPERQFRVLRP